jgi:hypothetical protein
MKVLKIQDLRSRGSAEVFALSKGASPIAGLS